MKKMTALNGRLIVVSRGIKEPEEGEVVVPKQYLANSDVCTTADGEIILRRSGAGTALGETEYIIEPEHVLAKIIDGVLNPVNGYVLLRKCLDPEDEAGIISLNDRESRFAEILAVSDESELQNDIGSFAYVDYEILMPQKIEETQDDWIVHEYAIVFVTGE